MGGNRTMTQEEFKKLWEADEHGSGITFDDIADRAKEWGLFDHPKRCDINIVRYEVLKAAKCVDAEEFNPYKMVVLLWADMNVTTAPVSIIGGSMVWTKI